MEEVWACYDGVHADLETYVNTYIDGENL